MLTLVRAFCESLSFCCLESLYLSVDENAVSLTLNKMKWNKTEYARGRGVLARGLTVAARLARAVPRT